MPYRHTDKGWFWGSKGPFKTKLQAIKVAKAAYASGFKESEEMTTSTPDFALCLLHAVTNAHILHLKADTYAAHKALGHFYTDLGDLVDEYVEAYQGKYGKIMDYGNDYRASGDSPIAYMISLMEYVETSREGLSDDSYLQNIVDEITQLIASTLNKLRHYK